jgi:hypothetical protein
MAPILRFAAGALLFTTCDPTFTSRKLNQRLDGVFFRVVRHMRKSDRNWWIVLQISSSEKPEVSKSNAALALLSGCIPSFWFDAHHCGRELSHPNQSLPRRRHLSRIPRQPTPAHASSRHNFCYSPRRTSFATLRLRPEFQVNPIKQGWQSRGRYVVSVKSCKWITTACMGHVIILEGP